ncbi:SNF5-domain-containing protein [Metschnikowia bicuspidata var. bicuspidata NRRL YB-4993]|uniref:SNF5-domain-containing protein n=1 Tax=Metschnikowia bicuspidata var. bicuspidata NRRL YB-4993 TaxID=869754 RepID=A0A1A0HGS9_9ASCO|nr:SNF5-domain-containing protein [Metschnikowia bicuspidata var. bicuspidata NRRL YB-4993]OBA23201.1 SNF5-domain-containing protein [Metschnikowia bicuspidata var. bicuspidata NRRL YB-4993]
MSLAYQSNFYTPQALSTGLTSRLAKDADSALLITNAPQERSAKRNAQQINYAEFDNANDEADFEEEIPGNNAFSIAGVHTTVAAQKRLLKPARLVRLLEDVVGDVAPELAAAARANMGAQQHVLVPIKLNIEFNSGMLKLVDFFMWNASELLVTPDAFAALLCAELELPQHVHLEIVEAITKQLDEYSYVSTLQLPATAEYHVIVDLLVNLDKKLYEDKFEWDLNQTDVTPEDFAEIVVADMGLSREFKPAIAHSLHELTIRLKKEILDGSYNHELHKYQQLTGLIFEKNVRIRTDSSISNGNAVWEPFIEILSPWEIEKREIERERNSRRLKRENMRREVDDYAGSKRRATTRRRLDELDWRI